MKTRPAEMKKIRVRSEQEWSHSISTHNESKGVAIIVGKTLIALTQGPGAAGRKVMRTAENFIVFYTLVSLGSRVDLAGCTTVSSPEGL